MNPGTFQGAGTGALGGSITRYTQTGTITSSQTVAVPNGVQRIEALLVGGGGSGGNSTSYGGGGGGFGGAAIIEIPATGQPLQVVIGAGGAGVNATVVSNPGSPTYIVSAGTRYAEVGGGGGGGSGNSTGLSPRPGRSGGGGGGGSHTMRGAPGGQAPIGNVLWSIYPQDCGNQDVSPANSIDSTPSTAAAVAWRFPASPTAGEGGTMMYLTSPSTYAAINGTTGSGGGGGGGASGGAASNVGSRPGYGGGGAGFNTSTPGPQVAGSWGSGGGSISSTYNGYGPGGDLTAVSIWGYTGFAGGTASGLGGGGGGGLLGAGTGTSPGNAAGGNGGNGGGGGGGGAVSPGTSGSGGNGFAVIRFYF